MNEKFILDACCGGRMFWFNKTHPNALYIDIRKAERGICPQRPNFEVNPDMIADFRSLPFPEGSYKLVVWDPPHIIRERESVSSVIRTKYGWASKASWREDLKKGFSECWRVLEDYGVLIFKWNEVDIKISELLKLFPEKPLFGHTTGNKSATYWVCFMKIPKK